MDVSSLGEELRELAERGANSAKGIHETIVEVEATNTTPLVAGGPDGNTVRELNGELSWWDLRHTAVRGVWRWWVRALLMGLLWELGYDCDYRAMSRIEAGLGMGSVVNEPKEASRVILELDFKVESSPIPKDTFTEIPWRRGRGGRKGRVDSREVRTQFLLLDSEEDYYEKPHIFLLSIPRYYLLTMAAEDPDGVAKILFKKQPIPPNEVKLRVSIKKRAQLLSGVDKLFSRALILALTYGGLGQMTSRGFGKFSANVTRPTDQVYGGLPGECFKEKLEDVISELLESGLKTALEDLVNKAGCRKREGMRLPSIPTLHPNIALLSETADHIPDVRHVWDVLAVIGKSTMKISWKKLSTDFDTDDPGGELHTWVLGLPRHIKKRLRNGRESITGYHFKKDDELSIERRMVSPLRVTPFYEQGKWRAHLLMFLTNDLYIAWNGRGGETLYHFGSHYPYPQGKPVSSLQVKDPTSTDASHPTQEEEKEEEEGKDPVKAAEVAFRAVKEILSGGGLRW